MATRNILQAISLASFCLINFATAQIPYRPTYVLQNDTLLYIFRPAEGSLSQFGFEVIDTSTKLAGPDLSHTVIDTALPFLDANELHAFTPALDQYGNITVYTGDCEEDVGNAEIWTFTPHVPGRGNSGSWKKRELSFNQDDDDPSLAGPTYLNGGIVFSAVVNGDVSDTRAYFFGGMCPYPGDEWAWQEYADYSNSVTMLEPSREAAETLHYTMEISSGQGSPIPEAGFTLTGLTPSYSNRSDGTLTKQQNFLLVGGHTSSAFINMSQVALFALPQQGWTFIPVLQPTSEESELATRSTVDEVEPRSGHSAVLTPDGQHVIVFGGWIGDIETPAEPALAVLNVGEGYGGTGDWTWTIPTPSGEGLPEDTGLYGHGAAMLPGGVMMITGGYTISTSSSRRRRATSPVNTKTLFFNITSNTWITEYSPPEQISSTPQKSGPLATTSQKAGLGVGLGVGMAAVLSLFVFYIWYTRRLKQQRDIQEKQLQDLSLTAHRYTVGNYSPGPDIQGMTGYFDDTHDAYYFSADPNQHNRGFRRANGHDAERTGLLVEIPSPTRGLRRSLSGRASHHMSRYDERRVQGSGSIHPIDELEEEQEQDQQKCHTGEPDHITENTPLNAQPEMSERHLKPGASIFGNAPVLDPFVDSSHPHGAPGGRGTTTRSAPVSPIWEEPLNDAHEWPLVADPELQRHTSMRSAGRVSPEKSDRTGSNLSERSLQSDISSNGSIGIGRAVSIRSSAMLNSATLANPFRTPDPSPTGSRSNRYSGAGWEAAETRTQSLTSVRSSGFPSAAEERESFTTVRSSFLQLQAQGEALLGGNPDRRPDTSSTSNGSDPHSYPRSEASMREVGMLTGVTSVADGNSRAKKKRWLGSVRRALTRSAVTSPECRTRSLTTSTPQPERYTDEPQTRPGHQDHSRKRQSFPAAAGPRRAVSDAGLLRGKRGKQDWLDDELDPNDPNTIWRRTSGDNWGAPEDLAFAERERQKRKWRERSTALINLTGNDDQQLGIGLPTPGLPLHGRDLSETDRPVTPREEEDWDVEAAAERRLVQVMFTVPKSRLRVVNADVERSSILSLPSQKDSPAENNDTPQSRRSDSSNRGSAGAAKGTTRNITPTSSPSSSRVKDLVGRFEQVSSTPSSPALSRHTPSGSPAPSIRSLKVRQQRSERSLAKIGSSERLPRSTISRARLPSEDITEFMGS